MHEGPVDGHGGLTHAPAHSAILLYLNRRNNGDAVINGEGPYAAYGS